MIHSYKICSVFRPLQLVQQIVQQYSSNIPFEGYQKKTNKYHRGNSNTRESNHGDVLKGKDNDATIFGNYAETVSKFEISQDDPEDVQEMRRLKQMDRRNPAFYIDVVKTHLDKHEFGKAIDFVENRMLKIDKVKPDSYIYDLLISYCGRIGNVKEAFSIYNQIKQRGFFVTGGQYTSLFNAAAASKSASLALNVASKVRKSLAKDELHRPNIKNYNAMLKAFGRHGDLRTCLEIMDEVIERRGRVQEDTYNFLLQACVTDTNSGYRHALLIWHKMLQNKTDPSIFSFNLMLRVVRDSGIGAPDKLHQLFQNILQEKTTRFLRKMTVQNVRPVILPPSVPSQSAEDTPVVYIPHDVPVTPAEGTLNKTALKPSKNERGGSAEVQTDEREISNLVKHETVANFDGSESLTSLREEVSLDLPNMLAITPKMGSVVDLTLFGTPYHRLMLLGGAVGFLQVMDSLHIKPDMKTFTMLLEIVPSTTKAEEDLMEIINKKKIKFDSGFFNLLIKKRCFRFDDVGAKEVLHLMQQHGIAPDLITYGCLALGCRRREDGEALLDSVKEAGFRPNSQILGPLIRHATYQDDLKYVRLVLNVMKEEEVQPGAKLMVVIDEFMKKQHAKLSN